MKQLLTIVAICIAMYGHSQYRAAIGLRAGETSGLTIKGFVGNSAALEGIIGVWYHGLSGTLLYEVHRPAFNLNGMNWYYGGGGHVAFDTDHYYWYRYDRRWYYYRAGGTWVGVDGVIGLEYKIPRAPIALSLDLKPYIEFSTYGGGAWSSLDPGLGMKIAF